MKLYYYWRIVEHIWLFDFLLIHSTSLCSAKFVVSFSNSLKEILSIQLPVLVRPFLRGLDLLLLGVRDLFPRLDPTSDHHAAETVFEQISFGLEKAQGIFEFVGEHNFERSFGNAEKC